MALKMEKSPAVSINEIGELSSPITEKYSTERGTLDAKTIKWIVVNALATVTIVSFRLVSYPSSSATFINSGKFVAYFS